MTDKQASLSTQAAVPSQAHFAAPAGSVNHRNDSHKIEAAEEEPYTIKCICNFSDDDGNTIYCETCDTWQHIECFYPDNREEAIREDFDHSCAECKPRPLNRQKAIERTLQLRNSMLETEHSDKKAKRPPSKSHKKKSKPSDGQANGYFGSVDGGKYASLSENHNHNPSKKSKTSHRPSLSVSSQPPKRSPSYGNAHSNPTQPPSPATTPPDLPKNFQIHHYSAGFCSLYNALDVLDAHNNAFASLAIPTALSRWLREPDAMKQEVGRTRSEVFQEEPSGVGEKRPRLEVKDMTRTFSETMLRWRFIKSTSPIEKDIPLIELNGEIGFQKDYCADSDNLWTDLSSPLPFVFFHPVLPLYIDTRKEGSLARYVRRSCKPNAQLDTYLTDGSEYHFWLVSDRYISADEQITLPWDFRLEKSVCSRWLHLLGLSDDGAAQEEFDLDESEYTAIKNWIDRILSEYGGCACDLENNCAFARFHRQYIFSRSQARIAKKRQRKARTQTISPTSTSQATNSRAASEGHVEDNGENMKMANGKASGEDRMPPRQGSFDLLGILTEPTDRDKRKVAMVEDSFRRMEQQPPPRKKKRVSDGTTTTGINPSSSKPKPRNGPASTSAAYVDAGTSRSKSNSPSSLRSPNVEHPTKPSIAERESANRSREPSGDPRPAYHDASVQTDPVDGKWFSQPDRTHFPKRRVISLSRRLVNHWSKTRPKEHERESASPQRLAEKDVVPSSPISEKKVEMEKEPDTAKPAVDGPPLPPSHVEDVHITDAPGADPATPSNEKPHELGKGRALDLRLETPTIPIFEPSGSASSIVATPLSTPSSVTTSALSNNVPSPFVSAVNGAGLANPSPVKKKLSLSDYTKSRMNKAATKSAIGHAPAKLVIPEDVKVETTTEPMVVDKAEEVPSPLTTTAPSNSHP